jgi:formylglycine-generating enzyme required for sulfatase activity
VAVDFSRGHTQQHVYNPAGNPYTLPRAAVGECAARTPTQRPYPWGPDEPDDERANFAGRHGSTSAVGCFPAGATPEEVFDMAGNVLEWTRSAYADYPYEPTDGREEVGDPAQKQFALRGGPWNYQSLTLRASFRNYYCSPDFHFDFVGFRLARHLPV